MLTIEITNVLTLDEIPPELDSELKSRLIIDNPVYLENALHGRWNGKTPSKLKFYDGKTAPRGFLQDLKILCSELNISYQVDDRQRVLPQVPFSFSGKLREYQSRALQDIVAFDSAVLEAPTGSGKTIIALASIAERKQPTTIVVHTKELADQWTERIAQFLGIPEKEIGRLGSGEKRIGDQITVSLVQTLYKTTSLAVPKTGFLIVDECHRAPSRTFSQAVSSFDCRYVLGLSATVFRRDNLDNLINWFCGPTVHKIDPEGLVSSGDILRAEVKWRNTNFYTPLDPSSQYSRVIKALTRDPERNALIARDVAVEARNGSGVCLVLSDRKTHCRALQTALEGLNVQAELFTGDVSKTERQDIVKRLNDGKIKVLIATGSLLGEGFDAKTLSTLFLATPVHFSGRLIQYLGRILRPAPGKKKAVVFDYVDSNLGVFTNGARARARVYHA
jgi:superfamily II DNA or RNA helicase